MLSTYTSIHIHSVTYLLTHKHAHMVDTHTDLRGNTLVRKESMLFHRVQVFQRELQYS